MIWWKNYGCIVKNAVFTVCNILFSFLNVTVNIKQLTADEGNQFQLCNFLMLSAL